jgi:hypothetical protein
MCGATGNVRFGPEADITGVSLFDQLVCELLEMKRYLQPQRFGGLEVDNKLILRRPCTGMLAGFSPFRIRST